jgi:ABC-2 type transport system permease protein
MIASTRAELLRLAKWPTTWVIIGVWLALDLMFGYLFDYLSYRDAVSSGNQRIADALLPQLSTDGVPAAVAAGLPMFGGALVLILAALATGSGYGWGTWKTVFTQGPRRMTALGGTMLALGVFLTLLVALTFVVNLGASALVMTLESQDLVWPTLDASAEGLAGSLLIVAMWGTAGALVGIVARSPAISVGLGLVWSLVVESLLRSVAGLLGPVEAVTDVFPGTAAGSIAGALGAVSVDEEGGAPGVLDTLTGAQSTGLLALYIVAFTVVAGVLVTRRDV